MMSLFHTCILQHIRNYKRWMAQWCRQLVYTYCTSSVKVQISIEVVVMTALLTVSGLSICPRDTGGTCSESVTSYRTVACHWILWYSQQDCVTTYKHCTLLYHIGSLFGTLWSSCFSLLQISLISWENFLACTSQKLLLQLLTNRINYLWMVLLINKNADIM